jgi:hypothetical protein
MSFSSTRRNNVTARHEYVVKAIHLLALEAHACANMSHVWGWSTPTATPDLLLVFHTGESRFIDPSPAELEKNIEQLKIMYYTNSPGDTSYPLRVKANIAFAIQRGNAKIIRDF